MMKVLVTGGCGYSGRQFVRQFSDTFQITVLDKLLYEDDYTQPTPFIYGDVSDVKLMKKVLPQFDAVVHLAAIVGDAACAIRPDAARKANIDSVKILADYFGGRIIYPSSCSVYGVSSKMLTEKSELNPLSLYAETKIMAEEILKNKNAIILRLGTLHGVSERPRFDIVVNTLVIRALLTKEISVFGGKQWRPLLGLDDLTRVITIMIKNDVCGIYNLAGENLRIIDIANKVVKAIPDTKINITDTKFEDDRNYKVSCRKIKSVIRFVPEHLVEHTIEDIKTLHKVKRIKDYGNLKYSNVAKLNFEFK